MGMLPNISIPNTGDPAKDILQYKIELERRLRHLLRHIDVSSIILGLSASRIVSTNASGSLESVSDLTSWIAGTAKRVTVTNDGDGTITLSGPQDLDSTASPTFAGMTIGSLAGILKGTAGSVGAATAGTDYENPLTFSTPLGRLVNTVSIPKADATHDGYLDKNDWSTFNGKQAALGYTPVNDSGDNMTGDLTFDSSKGPVVKSPDGTSWRITVDNAGVVSATSI
jgi:hypothetical protein